MTAIPLTAPTHGRRPRSRGGWTPITHTCAHIEIVAEEEVRERLIAVAEGLGQEGVS